ncbi:MAG: NADPH-dependent 7-cyano-7-deazaguanine reductase QueF [Gammaproteobacteria bacterium]|nr:NADPH-dependent 7-cyano-7-deazaguanine reductase QueF [Gammaproteobacteria bacterium]
MNDRDGPVLGRQVSSSKRYTPDLLEPIERAAQRRAAGLEAFRFRGEDVWRCYEMSWLNARGRPVVSPLCIRIPCTSPATVESKSLKLYLNAFMQECVASAEDVLQTIAADLGRTCRAPVAVTPLGLAGSGLRPDAPAGCSLDDLDVAVDAYERDASLLAAGGERVRERLYTHLFASVCPVTGQPDWGSLIVDYLGPRLDRDRLLRYLVSYRCHEAFHETIVEQVFTDLATRCACEGLTVQGCFLRRGGIDINPFRSTEADTAPPLRLPRQ